MPDDRNHSAAAGLDTRRPFTTAQGRAAGMSIRTITGPLHARIARGVHVSAGREGDFAVRAEAALLLSPPGSRLSHHSAGRLWGLWLPDDPRIHVSVPVDSGRHSRPLMQVHRLSPEAARWDWEVNGLPLTGLDETLLGLAGCLSPVDLVGAIDSSYALGMTSPTHLADYAAGQQRHGARNLRQAVAMSRPGARSPRETAVRLLLGAAGYPEPELNYPIRTPRGTTVLLDLAYRAWKLAVEYDGRQHAESPAQYDKDVRRREDVAGSGWHLIVAVNRDLTVAPAGFLDRVDAMVRRTGGTPPRRRSEWRSLFGGRVPLPRD